MWWENLSVRGREAWQLRLQSAAITIAVVAAGGVVQFYLAQAGEGERLRRLTYEVCCFYLLPHTHPIAFPPWYNLGLIGEPYSSMFGE